MAIRPIANPVKGRGVSGIQPPVRYTPVSAPRGPVGVITNQFGLNSLPASPAQGSVGMPSPSVGSTIAQTGRVPAPVLSGLPFATPVVGSSFGVHSSTPPAVQPRGGPLQNVIGERY